MTLEFGGNKRTRATAATLRLSSLSPRYRARRRARSARPPRQRPPPWNTRDGKRAEEEAATRAWTRPSAAALSAASAPPCGFSCCPPLLARCRPDLATSSATRAVGALAVTGRQRAVVAAGRLGVVHPPPRRRLAPPPRVTPPPCTPRAPQGSPRAASTSGSRRSRAPRIGTGTASCGPALLHGSCRRAGGPQAGRHRIASLLRRSYVASDWSGTPDHHPRSSTPEPLLLSWTRPHPRGATASSLRRRPLCRYSPHDAPRRQPAASFLLAA